MALNIELMDLGVWVGLAVAVLIFAGVVWDARSDNPGRRQPPWR